MDFHSSQTDMDGMKTQIRFVDPTRSAEANAKFSTETALAELYATVQMMPESSKKKKLIKQVIQSWSSLVCNKQPSSLFSFNNTIERTTWGE